MRRVPVGAVRAAIVRMNVSGSTSHVRACRRRTFGAPSSSLSREFHHASDAREEERRQPVR